MSKSKMMDRFANGWTEELEGRLNVGSYIYDMVRGNIRRGRISTRLKHACGDCGSTDKGGVPYCPNVDTDIRNVD